jgi:hypothetical protein
LLSAAFLGLVFMAPAAQAQDPGVVTPRFECHTPMPDGTSRVVLSYESSRDLELSSSESELTPAPLSGSAPTSFKAGDQHGVAVVQADSFAELTWTVQGKSVVFSDATTPTCGEAAALPGGGNGLVGPLINIGIGVVSLPLILLGLRRLAQRGGR